MNQFWLHSTKYDGSLHYRYPVDRVHTSEQLLITHAGPGIPVESYRGTWAGKKHILSWYWRGRPYVFHVLWDSQWQPEALYTDISTATGWDDTTVRYVDLDLDVILRHGTESAHLDDQDEFEANRLRWNYPMDLVSGCWGAVDEVRGLVGTRKYPFANTLFAWRPGMPLMESPLA